MALFRGETGGRTGTALVRANEGALRDDRVRVILGDAFVTAWDLARHGAAFDAIIVDLPDPATPELARLYSVRMYAALARLLAPDGAIANQSGSVYHSPDAFLNTLIARSI